MRVGSMRAGLSNFVDFKIARTQEGKVQRRIGASMSPPVIGAMMAHSLWRSRPEGSDGP
eukprot:COSAG01_NODE_5048_length_4525_cov_43.153547_5_plen_59_part_00